MGTRRNSYSLSLSLSLCAVLAILILLFSSPAGSYEIEAISPEAQEEIDAAPEVTPGEGTLCLNGVDSRVERSVGSLACRGKQGSMPQNPT